MIFCIVTIRFFFSYYLNLYNVKNIYIYIYIPTFTEAQMLIPEYLILTVMVGFRTFP